MPGPAVEQRFHPDPRTKLALLLIWAIAVFCSPGLWFEAIMMLFACAFGIAAGKGRLSIAMLAVYCVTMAAALAVTFLMPTCVLRTMLGSFFMLLRKVFPCGLLAAVIVTTTRVNEFLSALARMSAPKEISIPFAVMLRYVPAIREDWGYIKDAMRMRGVTPNVAGFFRRPGLTIECLYVPLLMSASNVAEELSMASVARGIENPAPRTCYLHIEFRAQDAVVLGISIAVLVAAIACSALGVGMGV